MSEEEVFKMDEELPSGDKVTVEKKVKVKKPKKELSEERKAQLREQLKKGREKALENRRKKMLLKKIDKEADEKAKDEKIAKHILKKDSKEDEIQLLKQEIESLKKGDKTETLSKNMVLIGKVVDSLVEDNNAYKKRKEEKKKKNNVELFKNEKLPLEQTQNDVMEKEQPVKQPTIKQPKVANTSDLHRRLKGLM